MKVFLERSETEEEIVIVHKPYFIYAFFAAIVLWVLAGIVPSIASLSGFVWLVLIVLIVWRFVAMRQYRKEVAEAMKNGTVAMSGSMLNPTRPLTVRISKALLNKQPS